MGAQTRSGQNKARFDGSLLFSIVLGTFPGLIFFPGW